MYNHLPNRPLSLPLNADHHQRISQSFLSASLLKISLYRSRFPILQTHFTEARHIRAVSGDQSALREIEPSAAIDGAFPGRNPGGL
ncbi:hypothetical protein C1H46_014240 [Malus baccata]|uniref:Uncharacterized protein n=1 Tax=Malus baccata TaxID=106549 RepID=A0A540MP14_MALBA|nr:hypothetical protein C1H46_014240 [Malus baccata]